ncbi:TolC family protein [Methylicorpusculum oleiharenae]|uniref:TolC family protein n=1 Tax=Methylicorpusculum oleiharenae TaxID=1338687 RepID=UPI00135A380E|nr:TolC family protein [Methylicorpusculum oleiharenae]MCD2450289.1 TolC family protein [Methylicorpusculum oleiharenae]
MFALNLLRAGLLISLQTTALLGHAESLTSPGHHDPIEVDTGLTLSQVIDATMENYPDASWLNALEEESAAIAERSQSWTAGAASAGLAFQEATSGTLHILDAAVQVPLWNPGQRDAEQALAKQAGNSAQSQKSAVKLRIAGLIRAALWDIELANIKFNQAKTDKEVTQALLDKVRQRYELGDLARSDLLLAQSELLQKQSSLTLAEAEIMHARKRYISITQSSKIPARYQESLSELTEIKQNHPNLVAVNSQIDRKQAELEAIRRVGSGQTQLAVGINSDRGNNDPRSNDTESFNIGVSVPFGGSAHMAPQIAAVNVELNQLITQRDQLYRDLELAHHEAEHALEVNRAEQDNANQLKKLAEEHLEMTELSFSAGEINLMDLLKIQARTQQSILYANERAVMLQRDIALYNQAVGVLP